MDSTGQNVLQFGSLEQEDTWFELSPEQRLHFDGMRQVNSYLREEFHAIQELLWRSGQSTLFGDMPKRLAQVSKKIKSSKAQIELHCSSILKTHCIQMFLGYLIKGDYVQELLRKW